MNYVAVLCCRRVFAGSYDPRLSCQRLSKALRFGFVQVDVRVQSASLSVCQCTQSVSCVYVHTECCPAAVCADGLPAIWLSIRQVVVPVLMAVCQRWSDSAAGGLAWCVCVCCLCSSTAGSVVSCLRPSGSLARPAGL